ncbi:MAG: hypothetical protein ACFFBH_10060 [Promethearchaeota archaeon]
MKAVKLNKGFLVLLSLIFIISFVTYIKDSKAAWETETIGPNSAVVFNIRGLTAGMTIEVQYNVISGSGGVDAYLVEGVHTGLLISKPSTYLIYRDNSMSDNWVYEVPANNDFCVQFFNDHNEDITVRFLVQTSLSKLLLALIISSAIAGPTVGAIVAIILVRRRKKRKASKVIKSEPINAK